MIIECPACKTRAKLPDSKEGAKVRCSECARVYEARPARTAGAGRASGGRRQAESDPTKYIIGAVVVAICFGIFLVSKKSSDAPPPVTEPVVEAAPPKPQVYGWDSPLVQAAVKLHTWAHERNDLLLRTALAGEHRWNAAQAAKRAAGEEASDLPWGALTRGDQDTFLRDLAMDMIEGEGADLVANWKPFDGDVLSEDLWLEDFNARVSPGEQVDIVRLQVAPRDLDAGLGNRWVEWGFVSSGGKQLAFHWQRWISPAEQEKARRGGTKKTVKRTLEDGSLVIEGKIRPIPHEESTPVELRARIDELVAQLIAPDSKTFRVRQELKEIGKPAIPALLSKLAEIPLESEEQATQLNLVSVALNDITGYNTTFKASELLGATPERQESGLKQWFGWYDRKYKRFTGRVEAGDDLMDDPAFQPRSEKERRDIEKARRELQGG